MKNALKYSIDLTSKKTGLSKNIIRAWENRFNILTPDRTETNRRLYSDKDIEKLKLLAEATRAGHKIGNIHSLSNDELRKLIYSDGEIPSLLNDDAQKVIIDSIKKFDEATLRKKIGDFLVNNSKPGFIFNFMIPLVEKIGNMWKSGELRISHEHFATSIITSILIRMREIESRDNLARRIIVCTPSGQRHETGALIASVLLASMRWVPIYLGVDLPAEEIAFAAKATNANAVAMSVIFPSNESMLLTEIEKLSTYLPDGLIIIGTKFRFNEDNIKFMNVNFVADFDALYDLLEK
ncbi:hypothetical protein MASR1M45_21130 [Candidatus Kapaibacterium sp.]